MSRKKKVLIILAVLLVAAAVVGANLYFRKDKGITVTPGRVVDLAVNEGDRIHKGPFLLQIDPKSLRSRVEGGAASLQSAEASLEQMKQSVETGRVQLQQAQQTLKRQRDLWSQQLTTR